MEVSRGPDGRPLERGDHAALNDWMVDEWLERTSRSTAAISVPVEDGARAAKEIAARGRAPAVREGGVPMVTREGLGHPKYWPIYEAAADLGLPIAGHVGGFSGTQTACRLADLLRRAAHRRTATLPGAGGEPVHSGVFERFPALQIVLRRAGSRWMPSLMWRLDRVWERCARTCPHTQRGPSEMIREHFWFTTQPIDEPDELGHLVQMLDQLGMDDRIMFSSDYPHWDFDDPTGC